MKKANIIEVFICTEICNKVIESQTIHTDRRAADLRRQIIEADAMLEGLNVRAIVTTQRLDITNL